MTYVWNLIARLVVGAFWYADRARCRFANVTDTPEDTP